MNNLNLLLKKILASAIAGYPTTVLLCNNGFFSSSLSLFIFFLNCTLFFALSFLFRDFKGIRINFKNSLFIIAIPLLLYYSHPIYTPFDFSKKFTITTISAKNSESSGYEIWLIGAYSPVDTQISWADFEQDGRWNHNENYLVNESSNKPAFLSYNGKKDNIRLVFLSHPWSGMAEIKSPSLPQPIILDLYSSESGTKEIDLNLNQLSYSDFIFGLIFYLCIYLIFIFFIEKLKLKNCVNNQILKNDILKPRTFLVAFFLSSYVYFAFNYEDNYAIFNTIKNFLVFSSHLIAFTVIFYKLIFAFICFDNKNLFRFKKANFLSISYTKYITNNLFIFIPVIVWSFYLIRFYPANMSPDSLNLWHEACINYFDNASPVLATLIVWVLIRIWPSPAIVVIFQILYLSLVFAYAMYSLENNGAPKLYSIICTFFMAILPINGFLVSTIWKDIPYSITLLWLTTILYNIVKTNGLWLNKVKNIFLLSFVLYMSCLLRHNGVLVYFSILLGLIVAYRKLYKNLLIVTVSSFTMIVLTLGPLFIVLDVKDRIFISNWRGIFNTLHSISYFISKDIEISREDIVILEKVLPISDWKKFSNPYHIDDIVFTSSVINNIDNVLLLKKDLEKILLNFAIEHPYILIEQKLLGGRLLWNAIKPTWTLFDGITNNEMGLKRITLNTNVNKYIDKIIFFSDHNKGLLFFVPGFYFFISVFATSIISIKNKFFILVLLPTISSGFSFILFPFVQDTRYVYISILSSFIIFGSLLSKSESGASNG